MPTCSQRPRVRYGEPSQDADLAMTRLSLKSRKECWRQQSTSRDRRGDKPRNSSTSVNERCITKCAHAALPLANKLFPTNTKRASRPIVRRMPFILHGTHHCQNLQSDCNELHPVIRYT